FAPPSCVACGEALLPAREVLCVGCRAALPWLAEPRCGRCGLPAHHAGATPVDCPARGAAFDRAWAPLAYESSARALVTAVKFRGLTAALDAMAAQMLATAPGALVADRTLVPVPLHPARRRQRGFDQAQRLARALARRSGQPLIRCLRRRGEATRQLGAGRGQRLAAGRIEIAVRGRPPPRALLIDDVHTTGATLDACAVALRDGGCESVNCLTYARALE
ncbi:MAG TPA: ComF family protein, partial [Solirubrobacteraceae bacterium]|nr:ComF family protein [Solirubrobacteraceae bacterium]